jgi:hypothetical protein
MNQDEPASDPLLKAISEFRQELIQWIDSQLASSRDLERRHESVTPTPIVAASVRGSLIEVKANLHASGSMTPKPADPAGVQAPVPSRQVGPIPGSNAQSEAVRPVGEPVINTFPAADARDRLDALARQLGERLRASAATRNGK